MFGGLAHDSRWKYMLRVAERLRDNVLCALGTSGVLSAENAEDVTPRTGSGSRSRALHHERFAASGQLETVGAPRDRKERVARHDRERDWAVVTGFVTPSGLRSL